MGRSIMLQGCDSLPPNVCNTARECACVRVCGGLVSQIPTLLLIGEMLSSIQSFMFSSLF